jgi:pimeloyl-ACP methyl ester carboxylesterase
VGALSPEGNAADVAKVIEALAPGAEAIVGMSLGGITTFALAGARPDLVKRMIIVDVTPGVNAEKSKAISNFINGPATFPNFDELLARTIEHNPGRTESSLRRGILHNAAQQDDGSWVWRYRRGDGSGLDPARGGPPDFSALWEVIEQTTMPLLLVRGMLSQSVVDDADVAELMRRRPDAKVVEVANAGHSVQGDTPVELATIIAEFIGST